MTRVRRAYSEDQKAEAVGVALTIGITRAGRQLGIPHRNISNWVRDPGMVVLQAQTREQLAERLWQAVVVGVDEVLKGLRDPDARLSDKARALEVVSQQHALLTGGVTERTEVVDMGAANELLPEDMRATLTHWMQVIEDSTDEELAENEAKALQILGVTRSAALHRREEP